MIVYRQTTLFRSCEFRGGEFFNKTQNNTLDLSLRSGAYYIKEVCGLHFLQGENKN